jgi:hypothetical protein
VSDPEQSDPTREPESPDERRTNQVTARKNKLTYLIWIVAGAIALYLIGTGLVGILTKAR